MRRPVKVSRREPAPSGNPHEERMEGTKGDTLERPPSDKQSYQSQANGGEPHKPLMGEQLKAVQD